MTAATWAHSTGYGTAVALGPAQRDVLELVLRLTEGGRRPELTLGRLAQLSGRPVSSVHDALGRLRALGLIGCAARMGRHGAHRLWRVRRSTAAALDPAKHRRAVARLIGRFAPHKAAAVPVLAAAAPGEGGAWAPDPDLSLFGPAADGGVTDPAGGPTEAPASPPAGASVNHAAGDVTGDGVEGPSDDRLHGIPDGPDTPYPERIDPRETFAEKMQRHGIGSWLAERDG